MERFWFKLKPSFFFDLYKHASNCQSEHVRNVDRTVTRHVARHVTPSITMYVIRIVPVEKMMSTFSCLNFLLRNRSIALNCFKVMKAIVSDFTSPVFM